MNIKIKDPAVIGYAFFFTLSVLACNNRGNETDAGSTKDTNLSDTRRNSTDTSNYISDSTGKSGH